MRQAPAVITVFDDPEPSTAVYLGECAAAKMDMTAGTFPLPDDQHVFFLGPLSGVAQAINEKTFVHTTFVIQWAGVGSGEQPIQMTANLYVDGVIMNTNDPFGQTVGWDNKGYGTKEIPYIALVDEGTGIHTYTWEVFTETRPVVPLTITCRQTYWPVCTASPRTVWHQEGGSG